MYVFIQTLMSICTHGHLFHTLGYNPILFFGSNCSTFCQTLSVWFLFPLTCSHHFAFWTLHYFLALRRCPWVNCIIFSPALELPISPRNPGSLCWGMIFSNQGLDYIVFWKHFVFPLLILDSKSKWQRSSCSTHHSCPKSSCDLENFWKY